MIGDFFNYNGECLPPGPTIGGTLPRPRVQTFFPVEGEQHSIVVDKTTHRIRFEGETEQSVVVVIEPKEATPSASNL